MIYTYTCPNCHKQSELEVEPLIPARFGGPPEDWTPPEGGDVMPEECEHCGAPIDIDDVLERVDEMRQPQWWAPDPSDDDLSEKT